jgi:hypothetical protein
MVETTDAVGANPNANPNPTIVSRVDTLSQTTGQKHGRNGWVQLARSQWYIRSGCCFCRMGLFLSNSNFCLRNIMDGRYCYNNP